MTNIICIKCHQEKKRFALSMCCACYTRERKARINQQCSHCKKQPPMLPLQKAATNPEQQHLPRMP